MSIKGRSWKSHDKFEISTSQHIKNWSASFEEFKEHIFLSNQKGKMLYNNIVCIGNIILI